MKKFYIQSYYQYPVTFSSIGKTIPARSAQGELRNVAEFTEKEIDTLKKREPFFRELVDKKKIRVLDHLPSSYVPPAQRINEANDEAEKLRKELEEAKAKIAALEADKGEGDAPVKDDEAIDFDKADYKDLQKYAKDLGIDPNQKKAKLIEELKKAALETVENDPDAEVTAEEK
jgi:hypothetical protein